MADALSRQIDRAFAAERAAGRIARRRDELPLDYASISDEWLTDLLCVGLPDAHIVGHWLGPPDEGTNNRRRIHLDLDAAAVRAGLPSSVFCKATHGRANRQMLAHSGGILCETLFYNHARALIDIEVPVARLANYDTESFNSIVVLDDLGADTSFCSEATVVTRAFAEGQLALLARLHARFHDAPELSGPLARLPTWYERFNNLAAFHLEASCEAGLAAAGDHVPARLFARRGAVWPATLRSLELFRALNPTLCHGDVHLKNWYVRGDGTIGLSDWGVAHRGHWARDLAYTLATSLTVPDRRAWENELIAFYLDRLAAAGGPRVAPGEAWLRYRQALLTAFAFWTLTLRPTADFPDMQPEATARVFVERLATAIDDLRVLDAV